MATGLQLFQDPPDQGRQQSDGTREKRGGNWAFVKAGDGPSFDSRLGESCALRAEVNSRRPSQATPSTEVLEMQHNWEVQQVLGNRLRTKALVEKFVQKRERESITAAAMALEPVYISLFLFFLSQPA